MSTKGSNHWSQGYFPLFSQTKETGGEGRNRTPLVTNDMVIVPGFIGDSSRLCHYWIYRFPFGLLAILLAISGARRDDLLEKREQIRCRHFRQVQRHQVLSLRRGFLQRELQRYSGQSPE
jgi:hypothetical protein